MKGLIRALKTNGLFGSVPEWYRVIRAARYLGVPPWDLATKSTWWLEVALAAEDAEAKARAPKSKSKGG